MHNYKSISYVAAVIVTKHATMFNNIHLVSGCENWSKNLLSVLVSK